jgi:polysaccharide export outer membrane protein
MKQFALLAMSAVFALGGCSTVGGGQLGESSSVQVINDAALPEPTQADFIANARPYLIGPFYQLVIDVFGIPELSDRQVTADAAGRISFPVAGTIDAAGLTPAQLSDELASRLRAGYVRNPQVTVNLKAANSQMMTVDGNVNQPGVYPVLGGMTLMKAVATARGVSEFAKLDDVVVLRTVGDQRYAALYNLAAIRRGNYADPVVYGNDTIIVGESRARRMFKDLLQVVPLLTTPIIVAMQNN